MLAVRRLGGNTVVDALSRAPDSELAVAATWSIGTRLLVDVVSGTALLGLLLILGAWLLGPGRVAVPARRLVTPALRDQPWLVRLGLGALLLLLVWWNPVPWTGKPLAILILAIGAFAWLEFVRHRALEEDAGGESPASTCCAGRAADLSMLNRVRELASTPGSMLGRLALRLTDIGGVQRATILGAQAFTSLIPYLVIASALVPTARNESFADTLVDNFDLEGRAAEGIHDLFASAGEVESAITVIGLVILLLSVTSFARTLQSTYERAYRLEPSGLAGLPRSLLWLGVLAIWLGLSSIRSEMQDWGGPVFSATVALGFSFGLWLCVPADPAGGPSRDAPAHSVCGRVRRPDDGAAGGVGGLHATPDRERRAPLRADRNRLLAAGLAAHDRGRDRGRRGGRKRA